MKIIVPLLIVVGLLIAIFGTAGIVCYRIGTGLPVNHTTSVTGTVEAPPAKVFSIITNVADGAGWRKQVESVKVLPPDSGRDHWVETLGHGQTMSFLALRTQLPGTDGRGLREVQLADPGAAYGGTWLYELTPGANPNQTNLKITETGFINPPIYRFMMVHVMGMTSNLDQYMRDIQAAVKKS